MACAWKLEGQAFPAGGDRPSLPWSEAAAESRDSEAPAAAPVTTPAEEAAPLPPSSDSERSASSGDGPGGALYARVARREARPARVRDEEIGRAHV